MTTHQAPASNSAHTKRTLLLHPDDSVLVAIATIAPGEQLTIDGAAVTAPDRIEVGHKLARYRLAPGDRVVKYGAPIGSVTCAVALAGHVHSHNMQSDYIPSHSRASSGHSTKGN